MKKYNILTSFLCLLLVYGCNDTAFDEYNKTKVEENIPASVVLDFSALGNQIQTRATSDEATENAVNNLYVFIFNSNGSKSTGKYFDKSELTGTNLYIDTYSGSAKQVFAVANFELNGMMSLSKEDLDNITNKEGLMKLNAKLLQTITSRGSSFLMTGCIESNGQPANIDIVPGNNPISLGKVKLRRVDAKVQFNIQAINGAEFTLKEWKVEQLPVNVALFNQSENHFDGSDNFSTDWKKPEGEGANLGKTFSFYLLEHLRSPKAKIESADPWSAYALREKSPFNWKREGNSLPSGVTDADRFVFADDRSTYVVFNGRIKYTKGTEPVEGDVTYTIHLGYFDPVDGTKANDYNIRRNTFYTYNVKIASADRVLVEVETDEETHPGADGNLVVGGKSLRFDAHYETTMVEFNKDGIDENLTWYVKTPFDEGFASLKRKDYNWILFRLNTRTNNEYRTDYVSFSGVSNLYTGSLDAESYLTSPDKLIDVNQLVAILKSAQRSDQTFFDSKGNVRFTAFVQEYYYDNTPGKKGTFEPTLWKRFVNAPERVMNILSEKKYSPDTTSMRTKVIYSIRQASIQTMYNKDERQTGLIRAWGTEMIQDSVCYPFAQKEYDPSIGSSLSDGRSNTISLWDIGARWDNFMDRSTNTLRVDYHDVRYICMKKNRDLNGNNIIDKNEIRWYLAAINQLTDLWIGEKSFDVDARLYNEDFEIPGLLFGRKWGEMWFGSSTIQPLGTRPGKQDPVVLWSSEGSSIGPMSGIPWSEQKLYYRCIRNLGIEEDSDLQPQDFVYYNPDEKTMSLLYLDKNSIRDFFTDAELSLHHEREPENLPYRAFEVAEQPSTNNYFLGFPQYTMSWFDVRDAVNSLKSPCDKYSSTKGWRVPNQRELALMQSRIGDDGRWNAKNHMSRTRFSKDKLDSSRCGFSVLRYKPFLGDYSYNLFLINNSKELGGVRCVRDIK